MRESKCTDFCKYLQHSRDAPDRVKNLSSHDNVFIRYRGGGYKSRTMRVVNNTPEL
jgi:hypothetical protein